MSKNNRYRIVQEQETIAIASHDRKWRGEVTQLIFIFIYSIIQHTSTNDIAGQSARALQARLKEEENISSLMDVAPLYKVGLDGIGTRFGTGLVFC